jgi:DNA-binding MarR family transcriptional regulator
MTPQQKKLWEQITNQARESGMDNLHARKLYDELSKLINMSNKVLLSITENGQGLEVKISEEVYDNLALVGLLEKIKLNILDNFSEEKELVEKAIKTTQKYDA